MEFIKTFSSLTIKVNKVVFPYCRPISMCLIRLLSKKNSDWVKYISLVALNELVKNCSYVIIPYFHFPTLRYTITEMLKSENSTQCEIELMKLLGNLGYIGKEKYDLMNSFNGEGGKVSIEALEGIFSKVFCQTGYLEFMRNLQKQNQNENANPGRKSSI